MDINKIIPYKNNARHNEKAIPAVAESIEKFGFKGAIVLESRENPVIVNGHTRVAACKSLGWTDFPDEYIVYADGLTEDEIKAFRLADNKTGSIAKWNTALLKKEMKELSKNNKLDMSKYGFDFKSKNRAYGAERKRTDDYYNLDICNAYDCSGEFGMPKIQGTNFIPDSLIGFNECKSATEFDCGVHFFIDDYQFVRLWNKPQDYIELLKKFDCVLSPDFSCYMDMPLPMVIWNEYRRRALMSYWQNEGIRVIPTISWNTPKSYDYCFTGIPKNTTFAVSTVGVMKEERSQTLFKMGLDEAIKRIEPSCVLIYGSDIDYDFQNVKHKKIKGRAFRRK